ncbi:hypothetical protein [Halobellus rufus]|uniref:hypothetical protein n=1 Tax=Halobellus rufus TaxID=1448860 RepID=UPI0012E0B036|nr:hypothetical protein [Halobellus rufus]
MPRLRETDALRITIEHGNERSELPMNAESSTDVGAVVRSGARVVRGGSETERGGAV